MPTPYQAYCECGRELDITERKMDRDGDVIITVRKCPDCEKEACERGRRDQQLESE